MTMSSGSTTPIRVASAAEEDRVYAVLALAFVSDPMSRWAWPDPHTYLTHFAAVARAFGGRAFGEGTAHVAGDFAGGALWLPPGVRPDEETLGALMAQTVPEANEAEMSAVFEQMGGYHPTEPHWYLPMIGIDPVQQGRGLGSALLKHALVAWQGPPASLSRVVEPEERAPVRAARLRGHRRDLGRQLADGPRDAPQGPVGRDLTLRRCLRGRENSARRSR
jgi:ribosomal protein S18 acetylase RimI-like enzyme